MVTPSDLERERDEAREKFRRDQNAMLHDAELTGEERGKELGVELGEKRGELIGTVKLIEELLKQEPTPTETLRGMTLEQLRELADRRKAQLVGRS